MAWARVQKEKVLAASFVVLVLVIPALNIGLAHTQPAPEGPRELLARKPPSAAEERRRLHGNGTSDVATGCTPNSSSVCRVEADIKNIDKIICPFLSALVNEGVLPVKQAYTRAELESATLAAGLPVGETRQHLAGNFRNIPSDVVDIFNMEGLPNEHDRSTGVHDCPTSYTRCAGAAPLQRCANETAQCVLPSRPRFEAFVAAVDGDNDGVITRMELDAAAAEVDFNDANPIGVGTIAGSHGFVLSVFGTEGRMRVEALERLFLLRRFPWGFEFPATGVRRATSQCGGPGQAHCATCKQIKERSPAWYGARTYTVQPKGEAFSAYCTAEGWTRFMRGDRLNEVFYDGSSGSCHTGGEGKLSDQQITELIAASEGSVRLECGSYAYVVPKWSELSFPNWPEFRGEWSTRVGDRSRGSSPSANYPGFLIPDSFRVTSSSSSGMFTMRNPAVYGTSGLPCYVGSRSSYNINYYVIN